MNQSIIRPPKLMILCSLSLLFVASCGEANASGTAETSTETSSPAIAMAGGTQTSASPDDGTNPPSGAATPADEASSTEGEKAEESEESASELETQSPSNAACLTGTWILKNETFQASLDELLSGTPAGKMAVVGESFIRFDGGETYTSWQEEYGYVIDGPGGQVTHMQDAGDAGNYYADDEIVWVYDMMMVYLDAKMHIDGVGTVAVTDEGGGTGTVEVFNYTTDKIPVHLDNPDGAAAYECSETELILHADGGLWAGFTRIASD